jgi:xanthine/uracil/vitamin C permease (AzgA family)
MKNKNISNSRQLAVFLSIALLGAINLSAAEPSQHVMYRSRLEAEVDNFWWGVLTDNPWLIYVGMGLAGLFACFIIGMQIHSWWQMRKFRNRRGW